jgi:hypothetical protein
MWKRASLLAILAGVVVTTSQGCAAETDEADAPSSNAAPIIGTQRSAAAYSEAVAVQVNNAAGDFCSGVLVAPRVVLTAAHCVAFNPDTDGAGARGTWTVRVPFASTGVQSITASSGEPLDPLFYSFSVSNYDSKSSPIRDLGLIYLDTAVTGVTFPTLSNTRYPTGANTVSAVGRSTVDPNAGLVLSAPVALSATVAADGYPNDNKTIRITDGGDSGGPLFLEGTHTLVGTETRFDPTGNKDFWVRLDGVPYSYIQSAIAAHAVARDRVSDFVAEVGAALCGRAAACCLAQNASYLPSPTSCRNAYAGLGFEATARGLLAANRANISISAAARSSCLTAIGNTSACSVASATLKTNLTNCISAAAGLATTGAACTSSVECSGNAVCQLAASGAGTCQPLHAVGASCEVAYKGSSIDARYNLSQDLCTKRGGGTPASYCDAYDDVAGAYRAESAWVCRAPKANGQPCGANAECTSSVCAPQGSTGALTCVATASFVTTAVCNAFVGP